MLDFIPIDYYTPLYYYLLLVVIIITLFHTSSYSGFTNETQQFNKAFGFSLFLAVFIYMGLRPVSEKFGDMGSYAMMYDSVIQGYYINRGKDYGFYVLTVFLSAFNSKIIFFSTIAIIYLLTLYIAVKRLFPHYYYFALLMLMASFSFWSYGTNGIRNGIATSTLILAFSFYDKKWIMYFLFYIAFSFHSSVLLPIGAFFLTKYIKNYNIFLTIWFVSIFVSLIVGSFFENLIVSAGFFESDGLIDYFKDKETYGESFAYTGFRWDFLLYSAIPVFISYYFIVKKRFNDPFYVHLSNLYLIANAFWILVIRANFSNRFAYLSWFMMGLILIYPFLKQVFWRNQFAVIGTLILFYFLFSFLMNVIIK